MKNALHQIASPVSLPLPPDRPALRKVREARELAELVRVFQRLDPADRAHILKLSSQLADWHH